VPRPPATMDRPCRGSVARDGQEWANPAAGAGEPAARKAESLQTAGGFAITRTAPAEAQFRSPPPLRSGGRGPGGGGSRIMRGSPSNPNRSSPLSRAVCGGEAGRGGSQGVRGTSRTRPKFSPLPAQFARGGAGRGRGRGPPADASRAWVLATAPRPRSGVGLDPSARRRCGTGRLGAPAPQDDNRSSPLSARSLCGEGPGEGPPRDERDPVEPRPDLPVELRSTVSATEPAMTLSNGR